MNEIISHKRVSAGIYEVEVKMYDLEGNFSEGCSADNNGLEKKIKLTIDARNLTVAVRKAGEPTGPAGDKEPEHKKVMDKEITVTSECL